MTLLDILGLDGFDYTMYLVQNFGLGFVLWTTLITLTGTYRMSVFGAGSLRRSPIWSVVTWCVSMHARCLFIILIASLIFPVLYANQPHLLKVYSKTL